MKTLSAIAFAFIGACSGLAAIPVPDHRAEVAYLDSHGLDPADYVLSKFHDHDLVLLGEDHAVREHLEFVRSLIPRLYAAGVHTLCVEFGAVEMQDRLDALLNAETFDEAAARDMLFYYNVGWAYAGYADLYREAWQLNHSLAAGQPRFRIVNLSYRYDWPAFDGTRTPESMARVFNRGAPDAFRAGVVEREVIAKGAKAVIYMGSVHVFTRYQAPVLNMNQESLVELDDGYLGNRLHRKYPDRLFNIALHFPLPAASGLHPSIVSPAEGAIEAIMERRGNKPVGFDLPGTPLGALRDHSYYASGHADFALRDFFDGYVFIKPFKQLTGCEVDEHFLEGKDWSHDIEPNMPDPYWHRAESLEAYWQQIRDYANMRKRYSDVIESSIPTPSAGHIDRYRLFPSTNVDPRNVDVWLPANYDPARRYSVLYMHDGQMLFDKSITWNGQEWSVDETLTRLMGAGAIDDVIVVGVWNNGRWRHPEYFPEKPFKALAPADAAALRDGPMQGRVLADAYLRFLVEELKPFIDAHYSTHGDRAHTLVGGSSMGGLISMYAICEYPDVFGGAACISTHWIGGNPDGDTGKIADAFVAYLEASLPDPRTHKLYFDHGTVGLDGLYGPKQERVDDLLRRKGWPAASWMSRVFEGKDHSEASWSERLAIPVEFLLGKQ